MRIEIDRLPDVLTMLAPIDIADPAVLFASADLYQQFKSRTQDRWQFGNPNYPTPDSVLLEVMANGQAQGRLAITYKVEAKYEQNILITGLQWSQALDH